MRLSALMRLLAKFLVYYVICLILGYATLNRYDPRHGGTSDSQHYFDMMNGRYRIVPAPFRFRILVPTIGSVIRQRLEPIPIGSWDRDSVASLLTNACFVAASAVLLGRCAWTITGDPTCEAISALLYVTSFAIVNFHLAGLVDGAETFFIIAVMTALLNRRLWLAMCLVPIAATAKETAALFCAIYLVVNVLLQTHYPAGKKAVAIVVAIFAGAAFTFSIRHIVGAASTQPPVSYCLNLVSLPKKMARMICSSSIIYAFLLPVPLALPRISRLPPEVLLGSACMGLTGWVLGAWADIGPNIARPLFDTIGPALTLAMAITFRDFFARPEPRAGEPHSVK